MTTKEITAEINRQLELCNLRQLDLVLHIIQAILK